MANRPVYVPDDTTYVRTVNTEFRFYSGFAKTQRQRCVKSLHSAFARKYPDTKVLEVSSFSEDPAGVALSAFQLETMLGNGEKVPVEAAFQAGKIFENGGPYKDLLSASPKDAKGDPRLKESGKITGFDFEGRIFPTEPATLFYTWLYVHALEQNPELSAQVSEYGAFTDIVFNPDKSINCQAYACAVYVTLKRKGELEKALADIDFLSGILHKTSRPGAPLSVNPAPPKKREPARRTKNAGPKYTTTGTFRLNDRIDHPKFGRGVIKKITYAGSLPQLHVEFDKPTGMKQLSEAWVKSKCRYGGGLKDGAGEG